MKGLNVKAFALSFGLTWAFVIFLSGITSMFNFANTFVSVMSSIYIGYSPGIVGAIVGAVWGFVDGAIIGLIVAWLYNKFSK